MIATATVATIIIEEESTLKPLARMYLFGGCFSRFYTHTRRIWKYVFANDYGSVGMEGVTGAKHRARICETCFRDAGI